MPELLVVSALMRLSDALQGVTSGLAEFVDCYMEDNDLEGIEAEKGVWQDVIDALEAWTDKTSVPNVEFARYFCRFFGWVNPPTQVDKRWLEAAREVMIELE